MKVINILLLSLLIASLCSAVAQAQFRSDHNSVKDTTEILTVDLLLYPDSDFYGLTAYKKKNNFAISSGRLKLNRPTKFLLKLGTGILRGTQTNWENDNIPLYSHKNAWKYPGQTIKYPESLTEYEGFLERYDSYSVDN